LWGLAHLFIVAILSAPFADESKHSELAYIWAIVLFVTWIYLTIVNAAKRFHDFGITGWLAPIVFIPFVPLFMLFLSGTQGINKYGEQPKGFLA